MRLDELIDVIEGCQTVEQLKQALQQVAETYGFAGYGYVDVGHPGLDNPFWMATSDKQWIQDYQTNNFVEFDPVLPIVRRTNVPFAWSSLSAPKRTGRRKPKSLLIMEAARDFGFMDGYVVPFHFVDKMGRLNSASCGFYWREKQSLFFKIPRHYKTDLHILLIYWAQRVLDLMARDGGRADRFHNAADEAIALTDREKLILEWAARGKTVPETGIILSISAETVETHMRNAMRKLDAVNKTQAAVKAIKLGLIEV